MSTYPRPCNSYTLQALTNAVRLILTKADSILSRFGIDDSGINVNLYDERMTLLTIINDSEFLAIDETTCRGDRG